MKVTSTLASLAFALLATSSCMDRKTFHDDASASDGAGGLDSTGKQGLDGAVALDTMVQVDVGGGEVANAPDVPISVPDAPAGVVDTGPTQTGGATGTGGIVATGGSVGLDAPTASGGIGAGGVSGGTGGKTGIDASVATGGSGTGGASGGTGGTGDASGLLGNGSTCSTGTACSSGVCKDGVCCNKACTGSCEACDIGTSVGTCTPLGLNASPRAGRTPCVAADATCAGKCDGTSAACAYPPSNTTCGTAICANGAFTTPGTCSGSGTCSPGSAGNCGAYACVSATSTSCKSSCTTNGDCASGYTCSSQACVSPDTTPPTIISVSPLNGTKGVAASATVTLNFSETMDKASVASALSITGLVATDLGLSWNGAATSVTITPISGLTYATGQSPGVAAKTYTITVGTGARDLAGNAMASAFSSNFATLRRIKYEFSPETVIVSNTYGNPNLSCTDPLQIGGWSGPYASGAYVAYLVFDVSAIGSASAMHAVESAMLTGHQISPTGSFYSISAVHVNKIQYYSSLYNIQSYEVLADVGILALSYASVSSLETLPSFRADFVSNGVTKHMYTIAPTTPTTPWSSSVDCANFTCLGFYLTVTYVIQ